MTTYQTAIEIGVKWELGVEDCSPLGTTIETGTAPVQRQAVAAMGERSILSLPAAAAGPD